MGFLHHCSKFVLNESASKKTFILLGQGIAVEKWFPPEGGSFEKHFNYISLLMSLENLICFQSQSVVASD